MRRRIRALLIFEAATYAIAALIHTGFIVHGYEHDKARIAELVIAAVLALGAVIAFTRPAVTRRAALWSQGFALVGTLVGVLTIVLGVGPRTMPDVVYHAAIICVLIYGLIVARPLVNT